MSSNMYTRNHAQYTPPRKPFNPAVKSTPQLQRSCVFFFFNEGGKLTIVFDSRDNIFPRSFSVQRGVTQNK